MTLVIFADKSYEEIPARTISGEILANYEVWMPSHTFRVDSNQGIDSDDFTISTDKNLAVKSLQIFHSSKIKFLPIGVDDKFPNLEDFSIDNCSIKIISYENFRGLFNLKELHIVFTEIETIKSGIFDDLNNLIELDLSGNKISFIAEDAFKSLKSLSNLILNQNQLTTLSFNLDSCLNLRYFAIQENDISIIPKGLLRYNKKLNYFFAASNQLQSIPSRALGRKNMLVVDLSYNTCIDFKYQKNKAKSAHLQYYESFKSKDIKFLKGDLKKKCSEDEEKEEKSTNLASKTLECMINFSIIPCL